MASTLPHFDTFNLSLSSSAMCLLNATKKMLFHFGRRRQPWMPTQVFPVPGPLLTTKCPLAASMYFQMSSCSSEPGSLTMGLYLWTKTLFSSPTLRMPRHLGNSEQLQNFPYLPSRRIMYSPQYWHSGDFVFGSGMSL